MFCLRIERYMIARTLFIITERSAFGSLQERSSLNRTFFTCNERSSLSKARGRSEAEGAPAPPQAARGFPHFVPPSFEAMQGLYNY